MPKPKTKTHSESVTAYIKKTYHTFTPRVPKQIAADFKAKCEANGTKPNRIINEWIKNYVKSE